MKRLWPLAIVIPLIVTILLIVSCGLRPGATPANGAASSTVTATISQPMPTSSRTMAPSSASTSNASASSGTAIVSSSGPSATAAASSSASDSYYFPLLEVSVKSAIPETASPFADAVMKTDQETYFTSADKIQFTIEKHSKNEVMTGEPYSLEIFRDNAWYTVPFKKPAGNAVRAWPAVGYPIPAKGSWSDAISLSEHVPLIAGRYRLAKGILTQNRKDYWGSSYIRAEFRVIDAN